MTIEQIINMITQNGIGIACVVYMIYFQLTTMKDMTKAMTVIGNRLERIEEKLDIEEEKENA